MCGIVSCWLPIIASHLFMLKFCGIFTVSKVILWYCKNEPSLNRALGFVLLRAVGFFGSGVLAVLDIYIWSPTR